MHHKLPCMEATELSDLGHSPNEPFGYSNSADCGRQLYDGEMADVGVHGREIGRD
jgi:hypothetical protein